MVEFWKAGGAATGTSAQAAKQVEAEGWDGQMFMDSQSLGCDPYVLMGAWAIATERIKLSTGVTNPSTRHPAVIAACAATVQAISGGRAVLGIGRGDSALAYLGYAPVGLASFHQVLRDLQTLLSGGEVGFGSYRSVANAPSIDVLSLGDRPRASRLQWLPRNLPKVPLDVAATGPKVIEMSAPIAERLTFSVGAFPERVSWALDLARESRHKAGLNDSGISYGAQVLVIPHADIDAVRDIATSFATPFARFQVMQGDAAGPMSGSDEENFAAARTRYDMTKHGNTSSVNRLGGASLTWDFIERFTIVGPPRHCVERLLQLHALGIDRFVIVGPGFYPEDMPDGRSLFAREVMPAVRAAVG
jgi:5,10-methylenetetrahydromethanopterin reductase